MVPHDTFWETLTAFTPRGTYDCTSWAASPKLFWKQLTAFPLFGTYHSKCWVASPNFRGKNWQHFPLLEPAIAEIEPRPPKFLYWQHLPLLEHIIAKIELHPPNVLFWKQIGSISPFWNLRLHKSSCIPKTFEKKKSPFRTQDCKLVAFPLFGTCDCRSWAASRKVLRNWQHFPSWNMRLQKSSRIPKFFK